MAAATVPNVPGAFEAYPLPNPLLIHDAILEDMRPQLCHVRDGNTRRMIEPTTVVFVVLKNRLEVSAKVKSKFKTFYKSSRFLFSL